MSQPEGAQAGFLARLREERVPVTVFLVNGVKLQGIVAAFDAETVLLRRDGHTQMVYKHAIGTVMPAAALPAPDSRLA